VILRPLEPGGPGIACPDVRGAWTIGGRNLDRPIICHRSNDAMEPLSLLAIIVWWGLSLWVGWRFMRAHERIADAVTIIAARYRGVPGKPTEPFELPIDADEPKP
jgi:hypothetical protein